MINKDACKHQIYIFTYKNIKNKTYWNKSLFPVSEILSNVWKNKLNLIDYFSESQFILQIGNGISLFATLIQHYHHQDKLKQFRKLHYVTKIIHWPRFSCPVKWRHNHVNKNFLEFLTIIILRNQHLSFQLFWGATTVYRHVPGATEKVYIAILIV